MISQKNIEDYLSGDTLKRRNAKVDILKTYNTAIPLKQLKYEIETKTGVEISNISLFMTILLNLKKLFIKQNMANICT